MTELKVVSFPAGSGNSVAATLRVIARQIDEGKIAGATGGVLVIEKADGQVDAYGIGDIVDVVRGIGMLHVASFTLTRGLDAEIRARGEPPPTS